MKFTVRVPATSANLGPGFDCLGLAWTIYAHFTFHVRGNGDPMVSPRYATAAEAGHVMSRKNLVLDGYWTYAEAMHVALPDVGVFIESDIPSTRGMGSSATCIVAGAEAARYLARLLEPKERGGRFTDASILQVVTKVEGHPDNVAPALYGGLQLSKSQRRSVFSTQLPVSEELAFHLCIPDFSTSTQKSRGELAESVPRSDAVANLASVGFLLQGLRTGNRRVLRMGLEDRLHEPVRRRHIPGFSEVERIARKAGAIGVVISGSGPTLLVFTMAKEADRTGEALFEGLPSGWALRTPQIDTEGAVLFGDAAFKPSHCGFRSREGEK